MTEEKTRRYRLRKYGRSLVSVASIYLILSGLPVAALEPIASGEGTYLNTSGEDLEALKDQLLSLAVGQELATQEYSLTNKQISLSPGHSQQLQLVDKKGQPLEGVEWFLLTRIPQTGLYRAESPEMNGFLPLNLSKTGMITAEKAGEGQIWARYKGYLYRADVEVRTEARDRFIVKKAAMDAKISEIVDPLRSLSDLDKILAVYNYLAKSITYDYGTLYSTNPEYQALVENRAVCYGYSRAFYRLMRELNITAKVVSGKGNGVLHAWNMVQLDGKWYHVDVTFADQWTGINYNYFLVDDATISRDHTGWYKSETDIMGGMEYNQYPYEKEGIFAHTIEELKTLLNSQLYSQGNVNFKGRIGIGPNLTQADIESTLTTILGTQATSTVTRYSQVGLNPIFEYEVRNWRVPSPKRTEFTQARLLTPTDETSQAILLTFTNPDLDLNIMDIRLTGAEKIGLINHGDGIYTLTIKDIQLPSESSLQIDVYKRGVFFQTGRTQTLPVYRIKAQTPNLTFQATDRHQGQLLGDATDTYYSVGGGQWHPLTADGPREINLTYGHPIFLVRKGDGQKILDSDWQRIEVSYPNQPDWVKSEGAVSGTATGKLLSVSDQMSYRRFGDKEWIGIQGFEVKNLVSGDYDVRLNPQGLQMASETYRIKVAELPKPKDEITPIEDKDTSTVSKESENTTLDSQLTPSLSPSVSHVSNTPVSSAEVVPSHAIEPLLTDKVNELEISSATVFPDLPVEPSVVPETNTPVSDDEVVPSHAAEPSLTDKVNELEISSATVSPVLPVEPSVVLETDSTASINELSAHSTVEPSVADKVTALDTPSLSPETNTPVSDDEAVPSHAAEPSLTDKVNELEISSATVSPALSVEPSVVPETDNTSSINESSAHSTVEPSVADKVIASETPSAPSVVPETNTPVSDDEAVVSHAVEPSLTDKVNELETSSATVSPVLPVEPSVVPETDNTASINELSAHSTAEPSVADKVTTTETPSAPSVVPETNTPVSDDEAVVSHAVVPSLTDKVNEREASSATVSPVFSVEPSVLAETTSSVSSASATPVESSFIDKAFGTETLLVSSVPEDVVEVTSSFLPITATILDVVSGDKSQLETTSPVLSDEREKANDLSKQGDFEIAKVDSGRLLTDKKEWLKWSVVASLFLLLFFSFLKMNKKIR